MKPHEAVEQRARLERYEVLEKRRAEICKVTHELQRDWEHGPRKQGPFTSHMRESRRVEGVKLYFTKTQGGADAVELTLGNLFVEAYDFSMWLRAEMQKQLDEIDKQLEML